MSKHSIHSVLRASSAVLILSLIAISSLPRPATASSDTIGIYQAIDLPFAYSEAGIRNVWDDVTLDFTITSPTGRVFHIEGFHHSRNLWMGRFAPDELGTWQYTATLSVSGTVKAQFRDPITFYVKESPERGFIRRNPADPKQWIYSRDGGLYAALGFGDCTNTKIATPSGTAGMDGGYRPKGYHEGIGWTVPYQQYLIAYGDVAGFNIFRFSDANCSYSIRKTISASGNDYDTLHSLWTDTLFDSLRAHGFRIYMTIFGGPVGTSSDSASMAAAERYVQYCIDRYGALVDFWELTNESYPDSLWVSEVANYFHEHDPYRHAVSVNWEQPHHPAIEIISQHKYGKEAANWSDRMMESYIDDDGYGLDTIPKPVVFGEQGDGAAWDSLSDMRMRGRIWSALFNQGTIIFWNGAFARDCCNQYLGRVERQYARSLRNFADVLDSGVRPQPMVTIDGVNIWTLRSSATLALYLRNDKGIYDTPRNEDVFDSLSGLQIQVVLPQSPMMEVPAAWYDPSTGRILSKFTIPASPATLTVPTFRSDIAFIAGAAAAYLQENTYFDLDVNPLTLDLTGTRVNTVRRAPVVLTNTGTSAINVSQILVNNTTKPDFSVDPADAPPFTIAPGASRTITVRYAPTDTGACSAMLSLVRTGSPAWDNIAAEGTSVENSGVAERNPQPSFRTYLDESASVLTLTKLGEDAREVQIFNACGERVLEASIHNTICFLDVHALASGMYEIALFGTSGMIANARTAIIR